MAVISKDLIKNLIGQVPFSAELYWLVRQRGKPINSRFSLKNLKDNLPEIVKDVSQLKNGNKNGKEVFIFASLHYWIEHAALLGMALSASGHNVTLGYLPYAYWEKEINRFDLKRQNAYARQVLNGANSVMNSVSLLGSLFAFKPLSEEIMAIVDEVTLYDAQYILQVEEVDPAHEVYKFRRERNLLAAKSIWNYLQNHDPEVIIIPNGTIQEMGVAYRIGKMLGIPVVTYEFGDQRKRIWIAQDAEVMRQETDELWQSKKDEPLEENQLERLKSMFSSRKRADLWENFSRRWQDAPQIGGEKIRKELNLDERPVILLATNVLGDSLTLGRMVFSENMASWISRTVQYFAGKPEAQLVIRVHPGEILTHGQSMMDVVNEVLPVLPEHIHLIGPEEKINTYDIMEVTDLGLVYTTTVGLEMALMGLPVIVAGQTHYRNRGFTLDVESWVEYFKLISKIIEEPEEYKLSREKTEDVWRYAYRFFFEFPRPYPWHLIRVWEDYKDCTVEKVFSPEGLEKYAETFKYLSGDPIDWTSVQG
ncbi:MAG: hypothetical protein JEZ06_01230 [Anaerolineaceae bacterium]|nr:hypothetical protein [Anaerolineaceae bacterium]